MLSPHALRQNIRDQRSKLHPKRLALREQQLARLLLKIPAIKNAQHIAAYWPSDGEISPVKTIQLLRAQGKTIYLPCIAAKKQMIFRPWHVNTPLKANRYGIKEPASRLRFSARKLDIVLTPLVGFDACGNRIGMGAGFYDRAFAFRHKQSFRINPLLIGVAHNFQKIEVIKRNQWDVPLSLIQTETRLFRCKPRQ